MKHTGLSILSVIITIRRELRLDDVSLNYFASILFEEIGIPMSEYQQCALQQYLRVPVTNISGIQDSKEAPDQIGSRKFSEMTEEYRMLTYHHTNYKEKGWGILGVRNRVTKPNGKEERA